MTFQVPNLQNANEKALRLKRLMMKQGRKLKLWVDKETKYAILDEQYLFKVFYLEQFLLQFLLLIPHKPQIKYFSKYFHIAGIW